MMYFRFSLAKFIASELAACGLNKTHQNSWTVGAFSSWSHYFDSVRDNVTHLKNSAINQIPQKVQ